MSSSVSVINPGVVDFDQVKSSNGPATIGKKSFTFSVAGKQKPERVAIVAKFDKLANFNRFSVEFANAQSSAINIALFYSADGVVWSRIPIAEVVESATKKTLLTPLIQGEYVQLALRSTTREPPDFEISRAEFSLGNDVAISSSGSGDRLWDAENLIDGRSDYGWSTRSADNWAQFSLGRPYYLSGARLRSPSYDLGEFPQNFSILISADTTRWHAVVSEGNFIAAPDSWYEWSFAPVPARYAKLVIQQGKKDEFRVIEIDLLAAPENMLVESGATRPGTAMASELLPGVIQLAENNSSAPNKAVQANDSRLRVATSESVGIVQLARDGQTAGGVVVQADDSRLRITTTEQAGIVQLAKDGESRAGVAVQGDDRRLNLATNEVAGITKLANSGDDRAGSVVQGNDERLKVASLTQPGIVQLAEPGEAKNGLVVQSDDPRLRVASPTWEGIVQLANHDESKSGKALQSDDPRLLTGDESKAGRVQFARSGENAAAKAVQGNDERLKAATPEKSGIVRLSREGVKTSGAAVQANDPRLEDARAPLPHEHDYAAKKHELNSHQGSLNLHVNKEVTSGNDFSFPSINDLPLSASNDSGLAAGFSGGVVARGDRNPPLRALSNDSVAIEALSRQKPAAKFFSERDYAVVLLNRLSTLKGSGQSLRAEGHVQLEGGVTIQGASSLVVTWDKFSNEPFAEGDLLTVRPEGIVEKMKNPAQAFVGVLAKGNGLVLARDTRQRTISMAVGGLARIRVDGPVRAGSYIEVSGKNPGVGRSTASLGGSAIAVALESSDKSGEKLIAARLRF